jgi:hypothetical protein
MASDVNLTNSTISGFTGSGTTYNFTVTPNADGPVTVDVPAATATDIAGNNNTAATQLTRTADITAPTVTLTSTDTTRVNAPFSVTATFSEDVNGFDNTESPMRLSVTLPDLTPKLTHLRSPLLRMVMSQWMYLLPKLRIPLVITIPQPRG